MYRQDFGALRVKPLDSTYPLHTRIPTHCTTFNQRSRDPSRSFQAALAEGPSSTPCGADMPMALRSQLHRRSSRAKPACSGTCSGTFSGTFSAPFGNLQGSDRRRLGPSPSRSSGRHTRPATWSPCNSLAFLCTVKDRNPSGSLQVKLRSIEVRGAPQEAKDSAPSGGLGLASYALNTKQCYLESSKKMFLHLDLSKDRIPHVQGHVAI